MKNVSFLLSLSCPGSQRQGYKKSVEPFRIHSIEVLEDLRQIEYDRILHTRRICNRSYHDLKQFQGRAECLCRCPCLKIFQISMLDNAKTLSLICTPSCDDGSNIQTIFEHSQRNFKKMMALRLCRIKTAMISPITKVKCANNEK